jgi:hypothetical protein
MSLMKMKRRSFKKDYVANDEGKEDVAKEEA